MKRLSRRFALRSVLLGGAGLGASGATRPATPPEVEGPFHPVEEQKDKDFDLTQVEGHAEQATGQVVEIVGRVLDTEGRPIEDAPVELWQANAAGRYAHPRDRGNAAPLDPHFQGWAIVPSAADGGFRFKTIVPGSYPAGRNWKRPPHIHFKVTKADFQPITTQMYFPGQALNDVDRLLQRKTPAQQALMIARADEKQPDRFHWDIVLARVGEPPAAQQD